MKGQHLVIGIVLFVILVVAAIYFAVMAEYNKDENKTETTSISIEIIEDNHIS